MRVYLQNALEWHPWFAWHPVRVDGEIIWLEWIWRRDICSDAAGWACAPIWEYDALALSAGHYNTGGRVMPILHCLKCSGEGRIFKSKYGGNDPDVWDAGMCEACEGSGNAVCDMRGCKDPAVGFDEDGNALCEDCLMEAASA